MFDFTCPFCLNTYAKSKVKSVCPTCEKETKRTALMRMMQGSIPCKTPGCFGTAYIWQCPACGESIPQDALQTPNLPFSIVGVSGAGKTNFITVMLHELGRNAGLRLALGHQTNETKDHQAEMVKTIYEYHEAPPSTDRITRPQIWLIRNLQRRRGADVPTYTFTIFDGAGEAQEEIDPSSTECRYINSSKAIIITLDPLVLPSIKRGGIVDPDVLEHSRAGEVEEKNASDVVNGIVNYIKSARRIRSSKMLDIPVAVVLTKIDTVLSHPAFGKQAIIQNSSLTIRNGKVDETEMKQVDYEIRNWLMQIGEESFINTLDANFKEYMFFGVSSLGAPPVDNTTFPDEIKPHRILDPILWLFKHEKFID